MPTSPSFLVLCTGNSCRSQMAEGWLRHFLGEGARVESAGIEAHGLNPRAVAAMAEVGIDISSQTSNRIEDFEGERFDYVVTVCDNARENCPVFPGAGRMVHHAFPDPADATGSEEEIAETFARVRDRIGRWAREFAADPDTFTDTSSDLNKR